MNKADLVNFVSEQAELPKTKANLALEAVLSGIKETLSEGLPVNLVGFGTFSVRERSARTGRNPQTGAVIEIPAAKTVNFKAGKAVKEAVQSVVTE